MTIRNVRRKLQALDVGGPIPIYKTKLTRITANPIAVAFVRMAGEARPWGVVYGRVGQNDPSFLSVPDPRNGEDVRQMMETFAMWFLREMRAVSPWTDSPLSKENSTHRDLVQVWTPGSSHVEMLHFLQYQYQLSRNAEGEPSALGAFGRLCGWLFRQSQLRGDQFVVDASKLLREMYEFPADDYSVSHLGAQLAWLNTPGTLSDKRQAASEVVRQPLSITMSPEFERANLYDLVSSQTYVDGVGVFEPKVRAKIHKFVAEELQLRWSATLEAHRYAFQSDRRPENTALIGEVASQVASFCSGFNAPELGSDEEDAYTPPATTSYSAFVSAREYLIAERAEQRWIPIVVHGDPEILMDVLLDGTGLGGTVKGIDSIQMGGFARSRWHVTLSPRSGKYFKRRLQEKYAPYMTPGREVEVTDLSYTDGEWTVTLTWDAKTDPVLINDFEAQSKNEGWVGKKVAFVPSYADFLYYKSMEALSKAKGGANEWMFGSQDLVESDSENG